MSLLDFILNGTKLNTHQLSESTPHSSFGEPLLIFLLWQGQNSLLTGGNLWKNQADGGASIYCALLGEGDC